MSISWWTDKNSPHSRTMCTRYMAFWDWLLSLSFVLLRFHPSRVMCQFVPFYCWIVLVGVWPGDSSPVEGCLDYFWFGVFVTKAARTFALALWGPVSPFLLCKLQERIAGLYDTHMIGFTRHHQTVFQSDCTVLLPHQRCLSIPVALHPCSALGTVSSCVCHPNNCTIETGSLVV